ncbi:transcription elongation factor B polypeptide 3 [Anastrepha ludens]|uniref:transcription elongation factor B polypeptide 3 n=1 Tax=Anastrepha ludens TaxID=28586 RepID=UPI0023B144A3|nr:transcription elongation factor B polypeptide 3 [Anastrepha ludens]
MSSASILSVIEHYQKSIEHSQDDEGRLLHCINKLYRLPVKVEHLQQTGVGKTVNSLRKYNGEIGVAAKALVTKWKAMVAAEEEPMDTSNCQSTDCDDENNANGHGSSDDDHYNHNHTQNKNTAQEPNNLSENTSKDRQSNHRDKISSEHKSKSQNDESSHKSSHSSSKHKRHLGQEDKEMPFSKKSKHDEPDNGVKIRESEQHKSSREKSERQRDRSEKQSSRGDGKSNASNNSHHKNGGDSRDKKDSQKIENTSSSKHHANHLPEKARKHGDSEKHSSSKEKDKHERSRENKHDKNKSSSKNTSHREKHHKSSTSHSSISSSKPSTTTIEKPTSSASHTQAPDSSSSSSRKRQHDSDSNDASPPKVKELKKPKTIKLKTIATDNEDEADGDDGIDSSMGANFADVLGMLNMPTKKSKKSLNINKSPTSSTPSKSTANDKPSSSNSSNKNARNEYKPSSISAASSTPRPIDEKPELLSASAKLAPLDPSIALELPTISANYKPLPHNKTVMDCVYRNSGAVISTPKPPVRTLTDAEALSHGISSKTMRTKIYSGIKTGQVLQVPSLFDLCIRILQKNIDALEYTGGVPFEVLRSVLERATPQQLLTFEEYNPYLMEDSDCLWQIHVQRNFRSKKRLEMESWREMFLRCEEEKEQKLNSLTETIKQSQKIIAAPVRKTQLAFVDSMVKPPRNVLRKQEQYGTKAKLVATPAARVAALSSVTPNAAKVGDTRLRVAATVRDAAQVSHAPLRAKKAPLMAKTLQFMRGRHKR